MNHTVLLCDDNVNVHRSLNRYLESEGIKMISAFSGESALEELKNNNIEIVILDIMLPGISGLEVCRRIRKTNENIYVIMLSAKSEEVDRIVGLEVGADYYMVKPFSPRELTICIRKVLKRMGSSNEEKQIAFENITVFPESYQVFIDNEPVRLTPKEVEVLACLVAGDGRTVAKEKIFSTVWGYDYAGDLRVVDSVIKRLRVKLAQKNASVTIGSSYGVGYQLEKV